MKLENQICSLELAKKLKELGVKQDSLFEYREFFNGKDNFWSKPIIVGKIPNKLGYADVGTDKVSAFTVAELGEMLPISVYTTKNPLGYPYQAHYEEMEDNMSGKFNIKYNTRGETEADARAKMLIYLLENNLTK